MDEARIRQRVTEARRIVVKAGTNVVMRDDGAVALGRLYGLIESVATPPEGGARRPDRLVGRRSGSAPSGCASRRSPARWPSKQACAAVGQSRLMSVYEEGFEKLGLSTAQVLLTEDDFADPVRFRNLSATLERLFALGVVPILNENDTVSTAELESPDGGRGRAAALRRQRPPLGARDEPREGGRPRHPLGRGRPLHRQPGARPRRRA